MLARETINLTFDRKLSNIKHRDRLFRYVFLVGNWTEIQDFLKT